MEPEQTQVKSLIQAALNYLAIRVRSRLEMKQYLQKKISDEVVIGEVMEYLDAHHLVDDAEFARAWAESRLRKGKGDIVIKEELRQKGVDNEVIQTVLEAIEPTLWQDAVAKTAHKYASKWDSLSGFARKAKLMQILYAKGFSSRHIDAFMNHTLK